jgi:hypothetical protein
VPLWFSGMSFVFLILEKIVKTPYLYLYFNVKIYVAIQLTKKLEGVYMSLKKYLFIFSVFALCVLALPGCTPEEESSSEVSFADLAANPQDYNGKEITIEGYWFDGFEIAVLAERLEPSSFVEGNVQPAGIKIWATGLSGEVSNKLYLQENDYTGYPAHYGKVELTGILEYGGEYGHLNSYSYRITISESKWIEWNP